MKAISDIFLFSSHNKTNLLNKHFLQNIVFFIIFAVQSKRFIFIILTSLFFYQYYINDLSIISILHIKQYNII